MDFVVVILIALFCILIGAGAGIGSVKTQMEKGQAIYLNDIEYRCEKKVEK